MARALQSYMHYQISVSLKKSFFKNILCIYSADLWQR